RLGDHFARMREGTIGMREVGGPHHAVEPELRQELEADVLLLEGDPDLLLEHFAGAALEPRVAQEGSEIRELVVHPLEQEGYPADAALRQDVLHAGEALQRAAEDRAGEQLVHLRGRAGDEGDRLAAAAAQLELVVPARIEMEAEGQTRLLGRRP